MRGDHKMFLNRYRTYRIKVQLGSYLTKVIDVLNIFDP